MDYIKTRFRLHNTLKVLRVAASIAALDQVSLLSIPGSRTFLYGLRAMHPAEGYYIFQLACDVRRVPCGRSYELSGASNHFSLLFRTPVLLNHDVVFVVEATT